MNVAEKTVIIILGFVKITPSPVGVNEQSLEHPQAVAESSAEEESANRSFIQEDNHAREQQ